jgi:hypothetical protein
MQNRIEVQRKFVNAVVEVLSVDELKSYARDALHQEYEYLDDEDFLEVLEFNNFNVEA